MIFLRIFRMKNPQHKALRQDLQYRQQVEKTKKARKLEQEAEEAREEIDLYKKGVLDDQKT